MLGSFWCMSTGRRRRNIDICAYSYTLAGSICFTSSCTYHINTHAIRKWDYTHSHSLSPFYHRDHHHQYYHKFPLHEKYISIYIYHCSSPVSLCFATLYRNIYIHSSVVYNNTTSMSMNRFATMVQKRYVFLSFCLNSVRDCGECRLCAVLCYAVCALCVILAS